MSITKAARRPDLSARTIRRLTKALAEVTPESRRPELTMRRRAHAVLQSLARLPVAILVANNAGRYVDANRAAAVLTGYTRRELLTRSVWELTPDPRRPIGRRLWREFLGRGRMAGIYQLRRKNGTLLRARYVAVANVLPGVHVSALVRPARRRRPTSRADGQALAARRSVRSD